MVRLVQEVHKMIVQGFSIWVTSGEAFLMFSLIVFLLLRLKRSPDLLMSSFYTRKLKLYSFAFFAMAFSVLTIVYSFPFFSLTAGIAGVSQEYGLILTLLFLDAYFLVMAY